MINKTFRRSFNWLLRIGGGQLVRALMRSGQRSALDAALGVATNALPGAAERIHTHVFNVTPPVTVYLRASHCRVTVRRAKAAKVVLEANLQRTLGIEFATEQDQAGVYIIARRKPVVGTVARAEFALTVPADTHLAFHLTPGDIVFANVDGIAELPSKAVFSSAEVTAQHLEQRDA